MQGTPYSASVGPGNEVTPKDLKRELVAAGFQIYRSEASQLQLAVRVRDNLIMDSGVSVQFDRAQVLGDADTRFGVRCVFRSQQSDHAAETDEEGLARARALARQLEAAGYVECQTRVLPVENPSRPGHFLDTWREVVVEKSPLDWQALLAELAAVLHLTKIG